MKPKLKSEGKLIIASTPRSSGRFYGVKKCFVCGMRYSTTNKFRSRHCSKDCEQIDKTPLFQLFVSKK